MKKKMFLRLVAMLLVVSMLPVSAGAVTINGLKSTRSSGTSWLGSFIQSLLDSFQSKDDTGEAETDQTTSELEVVTDETTVQNADLLRASTYNLTTTSLTDDETTDDTTTPTLKYFPVTLYDYDTDTINNATYQKEIEAGTMTSSATTWQGIYFNRSATGQFLFSYTGRENVTSHDDLTWADVQDTSTTYYVDANCYKKATVSTTTGTVTIYTVNTTYSRRSLIYQNTSTPTKCNNTVYYYVEADDQYYPVYVTRSGSQGSRVYTWYYSKDNGVNFTEIDTETNVSSNDKPGITIYTASTSTGATTYVLSAAGKTVTTSAAGAASTDAIGVTLYTKTGTAYNNKYYAAWNWWDKAVSGDSAYGQFLYSGLVESTLDANKEIVFTKQEGGIFNSDTSVKEIYTDVQMPFVYDKDTKTYTFDSDANGVYFHEDAGQDSSATAANSARLYFDSKNPQSCVSSSEFGDGSSNVWLPFNDTHDYTPSKTLDKSKRDYHFGMQAVIPFTMTANGRLVANDANSDAITFDFAGDDDVWVFVDGQLVVDLGGIHNRLAVEINFAENTVTYSVPSNNTAKNSNTSIRYSIGNANTAASGWDVTGEVSTSSNTTKITQTLFDTEAGDGTGLISQTRASFAATTSHELTIYYLERGEGSSNCKIQFNLPMQDTVTVKKQVTKSAKTDSDGNVTYTDLTTEQQTAVNNMNFGFTLYYKYEGETDYTLAANMPYFLLDNTGTAIAAPSTDAQGHFVLKNGQSAKFVGDMTQSGQTKKENVTYKVVEDDLTSSGFTTPTYTYGGTATGSNGKGPFQVGENTFYATGDKIPASTGFTSSEVTVYGSSEAVDSMIFNCENYVLDTGDVSVMPQEDKIVLDYGLCVKINPLDNDLFSTGTTLELVGVYGNCTEAELDTDGKLQTKLKVTSDGNVTGGTVNTGEFGTMTVSGSTIHYTLNKQLTDVEILNYVVKGTKTDTLGTETEVVYGIGTIYIIPATVMYYEENFASLVDTSETRAEWKSEETTGKNEDQEPGVVGTTNDSPYGSDVAYQNDSQDSNGTSLYANTSDNWARFSYTFTGTGTSFFARTGNNTGYMRVVVTDSAGNNRDYHYRDTYYDDTDSDVKGILYNIPVYTLDGLEYGTYTVTVTVAKAGTAGGFTQHSEFWLDGIRVFEPMDTMSKDTDSSLAAYKKQVAASAYATDGEANMTNLTLRTKLLTEADNDQTGEAWADGKNFVVFTDTNGEIETAENYESIGPKEEVYLYSGQSISFTLTDWDPDSNKLYLGIKAPTGSAAATITGQSVTLNNAADCYLELTSAYMDVTTENGVRYATVTIKAGESSLISVTNIKVTGKAKFAIVASNELVG